MRTPLRVLPGGAAVRDPREEDLVRLQRAHGGPFVSVLLATTPGASMALHDRARLHRLLEQADRRLALELPGWTLTPLVEALVDLAGAAAVEPTGRGLALFGAPGPVVEAFRLPDPVVERVVVDPSYATRDVARSLARHPAHRLLVLGTARARLLVGTAGQLVEHRDGPFPLSDDATPIRRRGGADAWMRTVDQALASEPGLAALPLVVVAPPALAARFRRIARTPVDAVVAGDHALAAPTRLATLARPAVDRLLDHVAEERLERLRAAVDRRRARFGVNEVWAAAVAGEVGLLFVEEGFTYPALPAPDGRSVVRALDAEHPDVLDDAVDEIVEAVARSGGTTQFVRRGQIPGARIAAVLGRPDGAAATATPDGPVQFSPPTAGQPLPGPPSPDRETLT